MPFTFRRRCLLFVSSSIISGLVLYLPSLVKAETKAIVAEASYSMGDGETPNFSEAMALQKAKMVALEQAGTYVQSFTQARNMDLTVDEIKTISGGIIETEILDKKRTLQGNSITFIVQIRALVATDKMEELVRRIKGTNVVFEYAKLQKDFSKLFLELDDLKRRISEATTESDRAVIKERTRDIEKQFQEFQVTEKTFHKRLISSQTIVAELEKSLLEKQLRQEEEQRQLELNSHAMKVLLNAIQKNGHTIEIGPPVILNKNDLVGLRFLVTVRASKDALIALREYRRVSLDDLSGVGCRPFQELLSSLALTLTVILKDGIQYETKVSEFHNYQDPCSSHLRNWAKETPRSQYVWIDIPRSVIGQIESVEGRIAPEEKTQ